jgi:hypothetical protein
MCRIVIVGLLAMICAVSAQYQRPPYTNQQYPNQQYPAAPFNNQFPNVDDLCNRPGANCRVDNRFAEEQNVINNRGQRQQYSRVCDDRGCYERRYYSGSSAITTNFILMSSTFVGVFIFTKIMNIF